MTIFGVKNLHLFNSEMKYFSNFEYAKYYSFYVGFSRLLSKFPFISNEEKLYTIDMLIVNNIKGTFAKFILRKNGKFCTSYHIKIHEIDVT